MIKTDPKGQCAHMGPARRATKLKIDQSKGPLSRQFFLFLFFFSKSWKIKVLKSRNLEILKKILKILNNIKQLLNDKYRPKGPICWKGTGPKGHYAKKELLDDNYRPEGPIRSKRTGPMGHFVQKGPARRAITFKSGWPRGPILSNAIGPKGQYVQRGPARRATTFEYDHSKRDFRW
jgi:hypothetical protein